jgi:group I intron endonuclease
MNSGVYQIECTVDGKRYIGRTGNFSRRRRSHFSWAKNAHLRAAMRKHGKENFVFTILETCSAEESVEREVAFIKEAEDQGVSLYNHLRGPSGGKLRHSPESIEKMASAKRGKTLTQEHKDKLSKAGKGVPKSESHRKNLAAHLREVAPTSLSGERRAHVSRTLEGNTRALGKRWTLSSETRAKMSAAQKGNKKNVGRKQSPETIAKRVATRARNKRARELAYGAEFGKPAAGSEGPY